MAIINCTPHAINVYSISDCDVSNPRRLFIKQGVMPIQTINPSGNVLNAQLGKTLWGDIEGIPVNAVTYDSVDNPLNYGNLNDFFIVSALFKTAFLHCNPNSHVKLLTVDSVVYDSVDNPRPVGCLGFAI